MKAITPIAAGIQPIAWPRLAPRSIPITATLQCTLTEIPDTVPSSNEPDFMLSPFPARKAPTC